MTTSHGPWYLLPRGRRKTENYELLLGLWCLTNKDPDVESVFPHSLDLPKTPLRGAKNFEKELLARGVEIDGFLGLGARD